MMVDEGNSKNDKYLVGYKRPPEHSKFVKGKSGNPRGRPKESKNVKTDLVEVLREKITIREGARTRKVTKQRGVFLSLVANALKGDSRASNLLLNAMGRLMNPDGLNPELALTSEERGVTLEPGDPNYIPTDKPKERTDEEKFAYIRAFYEASQTTRGLPPAARKTMFGVDNGEEAEVVNSTNRDSDTAA